MISLNMQELAQGASFWTDGRLQSVELNPFYGTGYLSNVLSFQSGISIVIQDFILQGKRKIRLTREGKRPPVIAFGSFFSGVDNIAYASPRAQLANDLFNIEYTDYEPALFMDVQPRTPIRTMSICISPLIFEKLTGKSVNKLVESLAVVDKAAKKSCPPARLKDIDCAQRLCGYQFFETFKHHPHDRLFLEAKALEFVALQLRQLDHLTGNEPRPQPVNHHAEKIILACEILRNEMVGPPTILELSRRVGLNHNQVTEGFKQILGMPPFEYLRTIRLGRARDLISSHQCNVTEAAYTVGYNSLSHFSKSYRKEFGISPKAYAHRKSV